MKSFFRKLLNRLKRLLVIAFFLHLTYLIALIWIPPLYTITMMTDLLHGQKVSYSPIGFEAQGTSIKLAVLAAEDQQFPSHYGIDIDAVQKAIKHNEKGKTVRGGSTISQQTAKNVFLWQGRNWLRKGLEVYNTFLIEIVWGKKKILEHYINVAEMGPGIYGVKAAAQTYFNSTPSKLTRSQAAWIAAALPNPKKMNPQNKTPQLRKRQKWIMRQMNNLDGYQGVDDVIEN